MIEVRSHPLGATLPLLVSPGSSRTALLGEHAGVLKIAVCAPPERGRANKELLMFFSRKLGVRKSALEVLVGETSREKVLLVRGLTSEQLTGMLEQ
jgi:uncharacterized protein